MKITTIGRGNIGGGLARLWEQAGHDVTTLGSDGGDVSNADAVLVAVPAGSSTVSLRRASSSWKWLPAPRRAREATRTC